MATSVTSYVDVVDDRNAPSPKYFTAPNTWQAMMNIKAVKSYGNAYYYGSSGQINYQIHPTRIFNTPVKMSDTETTAIGMFAGSFQTDNRNLLIDMNCGGIPPNNLVYVYFDEAHFYRFNSEVIIGKNVTDCSYMFHACIEYNQPTTIPNKVTSCADMFGACYKYNQPTAIPNNVTNCANMFKDSNHFNQPIIIPNSVTNCVSMFQSCYNMNSNVVIGKSVENCVNMFASYAYGSDTSIAQWMNVNEIYIPKSVKNCANMFVGHLTFPKNIYINNGGYGMNLCGMLWSQFQTQTPRVNVYCSNISAISGVGTNYNDSLFNNRGVQYTGTTNGLYNSAYNIYLYQNYSG